MAAGPIYGAGSTVQGSTSPPNLLNQLQAPIESQFSSYPPGTTVLACQDPKDKFRNKFKEMTGMSIDESISLYKARTGKDLSQETIEKLFTDHEYAKKTLTADEDLHKIYRDILNTNIPPTEQEAIDQKYVKMSAIKSYFHNPWYNPYKNSKYVSADGHREAVFDQDGNLISSNDYKGTFNFFGPDNFTGHKEADVDPYSKWGN